MRLSNKVYITLLSIILLMSSVGAMQSAQLVNLETIVDQFQSSLTVQQLTYFNKLIFYKMRLIKSNVEYKLGLTSVKDFIIHAEYCVIRTNKYLNLLGLGVPEPALQGIITFVDALRPENSQQCLELLHNRGLLKSKILSQLQTMVGSIKEHLPLFLRTAYDAELSPVE